MSRARSASHDVRRALASARLVLDVIVSAGRRDMSRGELALRMQPRGHNQVETQGIVAMLLGRGLLTADETTLHMTDTGWSVAARRTPPNRARQTRSTLCAFDGLSAKDRMQRQ